MSSEKKIINNRPLLFIALCLAGGIAAGCGNSTAWLVFGIIAGVALFTTALLWKVKRLLFFILVIVFAAGSIYGMAATNRKTVYEPAWADGVQLQGRVAEAPTVTYDGAALVLDDIVINCRRFPGRLQLRISQDTPLTIRYGDIILSQGASITLPEPAANPGGYDAARWAAPRNIYYFAKTSTECTLTGTRQGMLAPVIALRERSLRVLAAAMPLKDAALVAGMALGADDYIDYTDRQTFADVGVAHIIAVSGLNVGLLLLPLLWLLGKLRVSVRWQLPICTLVLGVYVLFTGLQLSMVRAAFMAIVMLGSRSFYRRYDGLSALSMAVIAVLIISPLNLLDIGFQLSVLSVLGMILLMPRISVLFTRLPKGVNIALSGTLAAQAGVLPLIAVMYGQFSVVSPLSNLLIVPLSAIVVYIGLPAAVLGTLLGTAGIYIASAAGAVVGVIRLISQYFASLPIATVLITRPSLATILAFAALVILISPYILVKLRTRIIACTLVLIIGILPMILPTPSSNQLTVTFLSVGNADCIHICTPDGKNYLIDGADAPVNSEAFISDDGSRVIFPYLMYNRIGHIDGIFITHSHQDHYGGFAYISDRVPVSKALLPQAVMDNVSVLNVLNPDIDKQLLPKGVMDLGGGVAMRVSGGDGSTNEQCAVFLLEYRGYKFLLPGDAPCDMTLAQDIGDIDVLKAPHHGAKGSVDAAAIEILQPQYCVISAEADKPDKDTTDKLSKDENTVLYNTGTAGAVSVIIDENGLTTDYYKKQQ